MPMASPDMMTGSGVLELPAAPRLHGRLPGRRGRCPGLGRGPLNRLLSWQLTWLRDRVLSGLLTRLRLGLLRRRLHALGANGNGFIGLHARCELGRICCAPALHHVIEVYWLAFRMLPILRET